MALILFVNACNPAPQAKNIIYPPSATPYYIFVPQHPLPTATPFPAGATRTPRPTPSVTPTPIATATSTPTSTSTPMPTEAPLEAYANYPPPLIYPISTQIPYPVDMLPQPDGQINIVLLGSDQRNDPGFRTDTIILVTLNPDKDYLNMTSIPRDLYVYIPGWTMQRINTAMAHGGFDALSMTLAYNFGVRPNYYVMINFNNFKALVDNLGGIDVQVGQKLTDWRSHYGWYTVNPGTVHMDGETALWYVRSRKTSSDIDRLRRAQEVIIAIGERMLTLDAIKNAPQIYKQYSSSVETNMPLSAILPWIPFAIARLQDKHINRYALDYNTVYNWTEPYTGAMVLLPKPQAIRGIMEASQNLR